MNNIDKGTWKERAFRDHLSARRDFTGATPVGLRYAICCGHRTGSNLLGEALFNTGRAGDPIEYLNQRLLGLYAESRRGGAINYMDYLRQMEQRRTSPNGVFGINVKLDQLGFCFRDDWARAIRLIRENDYIVFLYRADKIRQAISLYIGQSRDLFNVPANIDDETIAGLVDSVPFDPARIAACLNGVVTMEQAWLRFFKNNAIPFEPLVYEDLVGNFEGSISHILKRCGVPESERVIPGMPLKKVSNQKNEEFRRAFIDYVTGDRAANARYAELMAGNGGAG